MSNSLVLTVPEAAVMLGCSDKEVRRRMRDGLLKEVSTKTRKRVMVSLVSVLEAIGMPESAITSIVQERIDAATQGDSDEQPHAVRTQPLHRPKQVRRHTATSRTPAKGGYNDRKIEAAIRRCFAPDDPRCKRTH